MHLRELCMRIYSKMMLDLEFVCIGTPETTVILARKLAHVHAHTCRPQAINNRACEFPHSLSPQHASAFYVTLGNSAIVGSLQSEKFPPTDAKSNIPCRTPMVASALATAVNVFLDPLLIFALGWGCAGAAVATATCLFIPLWDSLLTRRFTPLRLLRSLPASSASPGSCEPSSARQGGCLAH